MNILHYTATILHSWIVAVFFIQPGGMILPPAQEISQLPSGTGQAPSVPQTLDSP